MALGMVTRLAAGVVHHRVQVADLAQAVAAQGERGGHEAEAPLADVERGPPVVVRAGVPVRHHHLGEREPVRHRAEPLAVGEGDLVQHEALAVVEAQPQLPVLPAEQVAVEREADPVGLADLQRRHLAQPHREEVGQVLAHHLGVGAAGGAVLDLEQLHRVQVDDGMQAGDVVGVRVAALAAPVPQVAPADPAARVAVGDERRAVGPHVGEDPGQVGDPAPGQRLGDGRVGAQHLVALVPLVDGHVGLLAGQVIPRGDLVRGQRHGPAVGPAVGAIPADHQRLPPVQPPRLEVRPGRARKIGLGRLLQLDGGEPPAIADAAVTAHDRGGLADLLRRQRVQRVGHDSPFVHGHPVLPIIAVHQPARNNHALTTALSERSAKGQPGTSGWIDASAELAFCWIGASPSFLLDWRFPALLAVTSAQPAVAHQDVGGVQIAVQPHRRPGVGGGRERSRPAFPHGTGVNPIGDQVQVGRERLGAVGERHAADRVRGGVGRGGRVQRAEEAADVDRHAGQVKPVRVRGGLAGQVRHHAPRIRKAVGGNPGPFRSGMGS